MISNHLAHNRNSNKTINKSNKQSIFCSFNGQNNLKNCLEKSNRIIEENQKKLYDIQSNYASENNVNDQNCSYNANIHQKSNFIDQKDNKKHTQIFFKSQNQIKPTNKSNNHDLQKPNNQTNKVINLKKKIKKCTNHLSNYIGFREKVTFKRKIYKLSQECENKIKDKSIKIEVEQVNENFIVYKDSQIFPGLNNQEFRNRIVTQRMDNDTETDDEYIEKFIKRISTDFLQHLKKVNDQTQKIQGQSHQETNHN